VVIIGLAVLADRTILKRKGYHCRRGRQSGIGAQEAAEAISGAVRVIFCGTGIGLSSLMLWLVWRMWREARAKAAGHIG